MAVSLNCLPLINWHYETSTMCEVYMFFVFFFCTNLALYIFSITIWLLPLHLKLFNESVQL